MHSNVITIRVGDTPNCNARPTLAFRRESPVWQAESIDLPLGVNFLTQFTLIGLSGKQATRRVKVSIARVVALPSSHKEACLITKYDAYVPPGGQQGYMVWGGTAGIRILDDAEEDPYCPLHLPQGFGRPHLWLHDPLDLPQAIRRLVVPQDEELQAISALQQYVLEHQEKIQINGYALESGQVLADLEDMYGPLAQQYHRDAEQHYAKLRHALADAQCSPLELPDRAIWRLRSVVYGPLWEDECEKEDDEDDEDDNSL